MQREKTLKRRRESSAAMRGPSSVWPDTMPKLEPEGLVCGWHISRPAGAGDTSPRRRRVQEGEKEMAVVGGRLRSAARWAASAEPAHGVTRKLSSWVADCAGVGDARPQEDTELTSRPGGRW